MLTPLELGLEDRAMSKSDELRHGAPKETAVHLCVDMQRMFAEATEWQMPWLERVLPNIRFDYVSPSGENDLHAIRPRPETGPGRRHVAALLRALAFDDHRRTWPRNDRSRSGSRYAAPLTRLTTR